MAQAQSLKPLEGLQERGRAVARHTTRWALGGLLILLGLCLLASLASYNPADPSFNHATGANPANWLGGFGAALADLGYQGLGLGAWLPPLVLLAWGVRTARGLAGGRWRWAMAGGLLAGLLLSLAGGWMVPWQGWPVTAGLGGVIGLIGAETVRAVATSWNLVPLGWAFALALALASVGVLLASLGLDREIWSGWRLRRATAHGVADAEDDIVAPRPRASKRETRREPAVVDDHDGNADAPEPAPRPRTLIKAEPERRARKAVKPEAGRQGALALGDTYALPSLDLLAKPVKQEGRALDRAALEQNARLLESVLDDYGVKGEIIQVRPGPVVTMYELEPAPGIKSSRVIGLTDDIARSMSAISARVAVVPGRNVIGIELPNARRETVYLRELLNSDEFENEKWTLPLVLGKNIAGDPSIADLAPMPHLLIAGTTGSGKSVGLNAMILSLLYRLSPDRLRFIMIDPKMLELSVYDGIPHLLAPVVTEPKKAIAALKWAVREMDDRYRRMASVNARSLAGFNEKVTEAKSRGQSLVRKVHTGYDRESGQPIYEEQSFDFEPMPLIVVVIDELADLMMVAGKEVEVLVQRLAQKARAAGIHLIMATQRPSVDVITGVIKANLPTRISFQVTSKIDSRTILGEQGAEQLLGKGDMLWMAGGKQIIRVHGPFVTEEEVERVADHWRGQGMPDYVEAVTEEPDEEGDGLSLTGGEDGGEGDIYRRAVQIVAESQKASTSYLQRQLRVGYNSAARLIERMEKEGLVGQPDHVGRREVFLDRDGSRL